MIEKKSSIEAKLAQNIDIFQGWVKFIVVNTSFSKRFVLLVSVFKYNFV